MAACGNEDGYDVTAQNYFEQLNACTGARLVPLRRQSISEARGKLPWQSLEYLLAMADQERSSQFAGCRYLGHVVRALDGTKLTLPRSEELLKYFEPPRSSQGLGHYPQALMVTAVNVFTGQVHAARVVDHRSSEREQVKALIGGFSPGDLSLLDRGLGGDEVYLEFERHEQFYLNRVCASGRNMAGYIRQFVQSRKKDALVHHRVRDAETGEWREIFIRLVRGPKVRGRGNKRIVFATNLVDSQRYSRRSLLKLYRERWTVETLYGRLKNLLKIERFHARNLNGVLQEVFAHLLVLSLTALIATSALLELGLDADVKLPSFKNALAVVKRHLLDAVCMAPDSRHARAIAAQMIEQATRVLWTKQPGRCHPRVSKQPIKVWNLAKTKKLARFKARQKARERRLS